MAEILALPSDSVLVAETAAVASCVIFFESDCPIARQAAVLLAQFFEEIHPALREACPPQIGSLDTLASLLTAEVHIDERTARWRRLDSALFEPFSVRRGDNSPAPQAVLVLTARHFVQSAARRELVDLLTPHKNSMAGFLILFLDPDGHLLRPEMSREQTGQWTQEFAVLGPENVSLHLVSRSFENGQPIGADDLAGAVAVALCADLVLRSPASLRILSGDAHDCPLRLSAFGMKALWFDPVCAAKTVHSSWIANLLHRTRFFGDQEELETGVVAPVAGTLPTMPPLNLPFLSSDQPDLSDMDGKEITGRLDALAPTEWVDTLRGWREALQNDEVPRIAQQFEQRLELLRPQTNASFRQALISVSSGQEGGARLPWVIANLEAAVNAHFRLASGPGSEAGKEWEEELDLLDRKVNSQTSRREWLVRGGFFLVMPLLATLAIWLIHPPWRNSGVVASGIATSILLGVGVWRWRRTDQRALRQKRDRVVKAIRDEAVSAVFGETAKRLDHFRKSLGQEIARLRSDVEALCNGLHRLAMAARLQQWEETPLAMIKLPGDDATARRLNQLLRHEEATAGGPDFEAQFFGRLRKSLTLLLRGTNTAEQTLEELRRFAEETLLRWCRHLSLWQFFRAGTGDLSEPDPIAAVAQFQRLGRHPLVYLQGRLVEDSLARPPATTRYILAPAVLHPFVPRGWTPAETLLNNVAGAFTKVELVRFGESPKSSPDTELETSPAAPDSPQG
jgi:hypothetical protein